MTTIRILLSIVASKNGCLHPLDINTTLLHGYLDEEVYVKCPFVLQTSSNNIVYKLNKSIYGLKQVSRQWHHKLTTSLISPGYSQFKSDYSLFVKKR